MGKLNVKKIDKNKNDGILIDGDGLRLIIKGSSKCWVVRIQHCKKTYNLGIGSYPVVGLAEAREKAFLIKRDIKAGILPANTKNPKTKIPTFEEAARKKYEEVKTTFKNIKHSEGWINSLAQHVFPKIGSIRIEEIEMRHIIDVLSPIWVTKNDTSSKIKQRIDQIIQWSAAKGYRKYTIDMRVIDQALPRVKIRKKHQISLPHPEVARFIQELKKHPNPTNLALEFAILTASRTIEVRNANWEQFDFAARLWNKPPEIMKNNKPHTVPLTDEMIDVLNRAKTFKLNSESNLVFQGRSKIEYFDIESQAERIVHGTIHENSMRNEIIKILGIGVATTHGFRSTFADWALEIARVDKKIISRCLSHSDENKLEEAYMRTDLLEARKELMAKWNNYCIQ